MINEERIHEMTQLALYEERAEHRDERIGSHYRSDYLSGRLLMSFFCATIVYMIVIGLYVVYHVEEILLRIYGGGIVEIAVRVAVLYGVFLVAYMLLTFFVYNRRYTGALRDLKLYYYGLKNLTAEEEERN